MNKYGNTSLFRLASVGGSFSWSCGDSEKVLEIPID